MRGRAAALLLVALSAGQLAAAGWSIIRYEQVLSRGTPYRIRTAPLDPADAFRGRYVQVGPSIGIAMPVSDDTKRLLEGVMNGRGTAYVVLANDADGFARAAAIVQEAPREADYLRASGAWYEWTQPARPGETPQISGYRISFPFDRYYMNERAAPAAEQRYFSALLRSSDRRAWLVVRVLDGSGVIEGLFIDGVPIEQVPETAAP